MNKEYITRKMKELAALIDYEYYDISHLSNAMHCQIIHKDGDGRNRKNYTNDSYATLGDAILRFIIAEYFFDRGCDKGDITENKQQIEDNVTLYDLCVKSGIIRYAYNDLYFYEEAPLDNMVYHSSHDVYIEAIIAAIYKDKGTDYCKNWVISFFQKYNT
ncbi:MAG: hypothetical protein K2J16_05675, partial [Clostridia bacterium]|nr:hypothetical protein [Clostridia bacterium]